MAKMNKREEFEIGDDPVEVERRARADVVISVRLTRDEADRLQATARRTNKTLSQTARDAITGYLSSGVAGSAMWTIESTRGSAVYLSLRHGDEMGTHTEGEGRDLERRHLKVPVAS